MNNDKNKRTMPMKFNIARMFITNQKGLFEHLFDTFYRFPQREDNKLIFFLKNILAGRDYDLIASDNGPDNRIFRLYFLERFPD
jgi:hypothetical protein